MKQIPVWWKSRWWAGGAGASMRAPPPRRPGDAQRDAEQRWENEGGNPPIGDPPDANPPKRF